MLQNQNVAELSEMDLEVVAAGKRDNDRKRGR
jgi:hypothetical protein